MQVQSPGSNSTSPPPAASLQRPLLRRPGASPWEGGLAEEGVGFLDIPERQEAAQPLPRDHQAAVGMVSCFLTLVFVA